VLGKKIEIVSRDDNGNPADAVRVAEELLSREKVAFLIGTFPSNVGLAVSDFAKQRKTLFIAAEPLTDKIVWDAGNAYTFRLRTSTYMQTAMLIPDAAKLKKKRWAIVYPNYEYGTSATAAFKKLLKEKQPDVEFVAEQAPPLGKIDAGAVAQALADAKPEAISPRCSAPTSPSSCARAASAACSRASRCSTCWPASRNTSIRSRRRRPTAGTSPAIPGARSRRPSIRSSSPPTRRSSRTIRGSARWSAIRS
jgi:branched-chain amino acid transport system substrate-binding protein